MELSCDVLILGASFAGIEVYRQLRLGRAGRQLSVILVDRQSEHGYIPLAHERLTGRLPMAESKLPTERDVARDPRARYLAAEVLGVDLHTREARLEQGSVRGRFLVLALGSELAPPASMPGHEHLLRYKFARELAETEVRLRGVLQSSAPITVIGGGISGVELAGDLALARPQTQGSPANVLLLEASDRLLAGMTLAVAQHAKRKLEAQGVEVQLGTKLLEVHERGLRVQRADGVATELSHELGIWAAGVRPNPLLATLDLPLTARGYLAVTPTLQCLPSQPEIFACGDAVRVVSGDTEWPTMQRAIECLWQAKVVGHNILTLAGAEPARALRQHKLRRVFPYGISIGAASTIVFGALRIELGRVGTWFRRFLMHQYIRRYGSLPRASAPKDGIK